MKKDSKWQLLCHNLTSSFVNFTSSVLRNCSTNVSNFIKKTLKMKDIQYCLKSHWGMRMRLNDNVPHNYSTVYEDTTSLLGKRPLWRPSWIRFITLPPSLKKNDRFKNAVKINNDLHTNYKTRVIGLNKDVELDYSKSYWITCLRGRKQQCSCHLVVQLSFLAKPINNAMNLEK